MHTYPEGSFGALLAARGINSGNVREHFSQGASVVIKLKERPTMVAPNSPMLQGIADTLKLPLADIAKFAKGKPMGPKWVAKISNQLANGTLPSGDMVRPTGKGRGKRGRGPSAGSLAQRAMAKFEAGRKKERGARGGTVLHEASVAPKSDPRAKLKAPKADKIHRKHPLAKLVAEKGLSLRLLAEKTGIPEGSIWRVSAGELAKNHPALPRIAAVLGVPLEQLQRLQRGALLPAARVANFEAKLARNGHPAPGAALVHQHIATPQNGVSAPVVHRGPHNKLRKADLQLRQSARAMVMTLNVAIMRGDTHMPPLPVGDLYLILVDYLGAKGMGKHNVLIDPQFSELFDPK